MKARIRWPAITALFVVGVLWVMSAIGAENPKPDGEPPPGSTTQETRLLRSRWAGRPLRPPTPPQPARRWK